MMTTFLDSNTFTLNILAQRRNRPTDSRQQYSYASNFPYVFHIKLKCFKILS